MGLPEKCFMQAGRSLRSRGQALLGCQDVSEARAFGGVTLQGLQAPSIECLPLAGTSLLSSTPLSNATPSVCPSVESSSSSIGTPLLLGLGVGLSFGFGAASCDAAQVSETLEHEHHHPHPHKAASQGGEERAEVCRPSAPIMSIGWAGSVVPAPSCRAP